MGRSGHWPARWVGAGFLDHRDNLNLPPPYLEGREKRKEKIDHSRLVGGRFHEQENLHTKLVLSSSKTSSSHTHLPNLKSL